MESGRLRDLAHSLDYARRDLETIIKPQVRTATGLSTLDMIGKLLRMLSQEALGSAQSQAMQDAVRAAVAAVREDLPIANRDQPGDDIEALLQQLEESVMRDRGAHGRPVWAALDQLAAVREARDAGSSDGSWETSYQESSGGPASRATQASGETLTLETLGAYVRDQIAGYETANVTQLERLPGGYSKATLIARIERPGFAQEGWVLRCDLPFTPLDTQVRDEFALLRALYDRGLPVPEPLWFEFEGRLGAPLMAVRQVSGSSDMSQWSPTDGPWRDLARDAARLLAAVHRVDVRELPPLQSAAPGCRGVTPTEVLEHVYAFWKAYRIEPDPLVELVFNWLRDHTPTSASRGLVHGDYGLHNLLVEGKRINALLDWEFAHVGDPREDLAYARPFVEKVIPWREFLDAYEEAGGVPSDDAAIRFYSVLGYLRNGLGCKKVLHAIRHNDPSIDAKFVYVGRSYAQLIVRSTAKMTGMI